MAKVSGTAVTSIAIGSVLLWSGIKGTSLKDTVSGLLHGQLNDSPVERIGTPSLNIQDSKGDGSSGGSADQFGGGTFNTPAGTDNQNLDTIGQLLYQNYHYSRAAAAGIAGCVAGESGGNPESQGSGGRGLIGWTPPGKLPNSAFTGNKTHDLNAQIAEIDKYNKANWPQFIPMLNAISDPVQAADFYSEKFERPKVQDSDVRAGVAKSVYAKLGTLSKGNFGGGSF